MSADKQAIANMNSNGESAIAKKKHSNSSECLVIIDSTSDDFRARVCLDNLT